MTQVFPLPTDEGTWSRTDESIFHISWQGLDEVANPGWYWWNDGALEQHGPYSQLALCATCAMFNDPEAI